MNKVLWVFSPCLKWLVATIDKPATYVKWPRQSTKSISLSACLLSYFVGLLFQIALFIRSYEIVIDSKEIAIRMMITTQIQRNPFKCSSEMQIKETNVNIAQCLIE